MRRALVCLMALSLAASAFAVVNPTGKHWKHDTGLTKCDDGSHRMKCPTVHTLTIEWTPPAQDADGRPLHFHQIKQYMACVVDISAPRPTTHDDCLVYVPIFKKPPANVDLGGPDRCVHLQTQDTKNMYSLFSVERECK